MAGAALVISWGLPTGPRKARRGRSSLVRPPVEPEDLYLDLDVVEVQAVYVLGHELFTHLTGGVGRRRDLATGAERPIETSEVSLTWRCSGRRAALELARQLNKWQADRVPLRLVAARGRCAALIEDDDNWVSLPELKLAV
jgi:hypothetical protein